MRVHVCVWLRVWVWVWLRLCASLCLCLLACAVVISGVDFVSDSTHACSHNRKNSYAHTYTTTKMNAHMYTHTIARSHRYTLTYTYTHTHTHTQGSKLDTLVKNEGDAEDSFILKDTEGNLVLALRFVLQFPGNLDFAEAQQVSTCDRR